VPRFDKILVANRGEIALRITRAAKSMGYRTVSVYSEADQAMPHVTSADESALLGPPPASQSYLNIERIIAIAQRTNAQAIHPGYGFLSESAEFAEACEAAKITFIGPSAEAIRLMGDKAIAKRLVVEAGVPCIPGYDGATQDFAKLAAEAARIGYPVMVKAVAGGGGKGIRLVESPSELSDAIEMARSEAKSFFSNDALMLEKAIVAPRHLEVQVFGDSHGNVIHIGDRDCSVQRRHQKVMEEAPAPGLDDELRSRLGEAAVNVAKTVQYVGAGTVEFLLDKEENFYFLEMNTRLQVEHPVTEMVTGLDLVKWQIRVAAGEALPLAQKDIRLHGHAIEARLYAEDPTVGFLPQSGMIEGWEPASGDGVRVDHGLKLGAEISTFYDPMIAKIIACGDDRGEAIRRLTRAIRDQVVIGVPTNRSFLLECLAQPDFVEGRLDTSFIGRNFTDSPSMRTPNATLIAVAAALLYERHAETIPKDWLGWRNNGSGDQLVPIRVGEWTGLVRISPQQAIYRVRVDDVEIPIQLLDFETPYTRWIEIDQLRRKFQIGWSDRGLDLFADDSPFACSIWSSEGSTGSDNAATVARSPMPGMIVSVRVEKGAVVSKGDGLLVVEAMKMETLITAPVSGVVAEVHCIAGQQVRLKELLVEIDPS
jgi:geranyl-CoA carboxylase alpha subunit